MTNARISRNANPIANSSGPRCIASRRSNRPSSGRLALAVLLGLFLNSSTAQAAPSDSVSSIGATSAPAPPTPAHTRPADWAIKLERPGVANLYQISTNLYRGAQPTAQGMAELRKLGVKTVVNLRNYHADDSRLAGTGLQPEHLNMTPWHASDDESVRFLKIVTDANKLPVFVHCQRGADRTGTLCAVYRVVVCGWSKEKAIREMTEGGFGFNPAWRNLVDYVRQMDVEKLRRESGIKPQVQPSGAAPGAKTA